MESEQVRQLKDFRKGAFDQIFETTRTFMLEKLRASNLTSWPALANSGQRILTQERIKIKTHITAHFLSPNGTKMLETLNAHQQMATIAETIMLGAETLQAADPSSWKSGRAGMKDNFDRATGLGEIVRAFAVTAIELAEEQEIRSRRQRADAEKYHMMSSIVLKLKDQGLGGRTSQSIQESIAKVLFGQVAVAIEKNCGPIDLHCRRPLKKIFVLLQMGALSNLLLRH